MTPQEYSKTKPTHLAEVHYFTVDGSEDTISVVETRAVFYMTLVRWEDHPWSGGRSGGADFVNHWTFEARHVAGAWKGDAWCSQGRSLAGWGALSLDAGDFATLAEARTAAIARLDTTIANLARRLERCRSLHADIAQRE